MANDAGPPLTRRAVLASTAGGAGAAAVSGPAAMAQAPAGGTTFVLVAGAWHGGWCWRRVSDRLERKSHKVFSPTFTGVGERSHLLDAKINLAIHVADIVNVIKWEDLNDIVLIGHSYAGVVISVVAEQMQGRIASIVFLDAFFPENGESLADTAPPPARDAILGAKQRGATTIPPRSAAASNVNEKDRAWVDAMCTPHPIDTLIDKVTLTGARERIAKRSYIRARGYPQPAFDKAYDKLEASAGWRVYEMPCGHDAMVDMPDRLVEILIDAVT